MPKTKPFLIIVHNDLDGGASAICIINHIKQKYGEDAEYRMAFKTYKNINGFVERVMDDPKKYERVFIADISVEPYLAADFPDNFILLDHHDTASELKAYDNCHVDTSGNHCGASLCYKCLLKDEGLKYDHLTKLVAVALDYDLWHHKLPKKVAKNLNFIYYMYWGEKFCERFENGFNGFNEEEKEFLRKKWEGIQTQLDEAEFIDLLADEDESLHNKVGMYINCEPYLSNGDTNEICQYALEEVGFKTIICVIPKRRQLSVRTTEEIAEKGVHVGQICEFLYNEGYSSNGGGHSCAGGANYENEENLEKFLEVFAEKIMEFDI